MKTISDLIDEATRKRDSLALKYTKPAKPPPRGKYWSNLWTAYSPKLNRIVRLYSNLEDFVRIIIESDPGMAPREQPVYAESIYEGKEGRSLLDFWILKVSRNEEFWEVKYEKDLLQIDSKLELKRQITIQKGWCLENSSKYVIVTDADIKPFSIVLDNWSRILASLSNTKGIRFKEKMTQVLLNLVMEREATLRDATVGLGDEDGFAVISNLLSLGLVDLTDPFKKMTWLSKIKPSQKLAE